MLEENLYLRDELAGSFVNPGERFKNYNYTNKDKLVLRELAKIKREISCQPVHKEKIGMWRSLNDLKAIRPMVWINEIPWHEMDVDGQLICTTGTEFTRVLETRLRRAIYGWKYLPVDLIVEPVMACYPEIENSGFGINEIVDISETDDTNNIHSKRFKSQIENEEDLEKIKVPGIEFKKEDTEKKFEAMKDIFEDILEVNITGYPGFHFTPWDKLTEWWDVQKVLMDLVIKPGLVHKAMGKILDAYMRQLDQFEELFILSSNNGNFRVGSGGLGYTGDLIQRDPGDKRVKAKDMWGSGTAQIFSSVSPEMHDEFALKYEMQWFKRFGLVYYGCCEPLDRKIDILRAIPNLRKISMSPWADLDTGAEKIDRDYVFSYKPNPSVFAENSWNPEDVRENLKKVLKKIKNCNVEIIMKDISTVRYRPQKLWEWAKIASEVVREME